jgi:hypothetical protein
VYVKTKSVVPPENEAGKARAALAAGTARSTSKAAGAAVTYTLPKLTTFSLPQMAWHWWHQHPDRVAGAYDQAAAIQFLIAWVVNGELASPMARRSDEPMAEPAPVPRDLWRVLKFAADYMTASWRGIELFGFEFPAPGEHAAPESSSFHEETRAGKKQIPLGPNGDQIIREVLKEAYPSGIIRGETSRRKDLPPLFARRDYRYSRDRIRKHLRLPEYRDRR